MDIHPIPSIYTYSYTRRKTHAVHIGGVQIGGEAPIAVQSMTNVNTNDIDAGVAQVKRIVEAGGRIVRFTAQGTREAKSLSLVRKHLNTDAVDVPLVADIHFNPQAAYEAAKYVEKVRINPGNFYDPARKFKHIEYSDDEYAHEVQGLQAAFTDFLKHCSMYQTAIRIGVNQGSLSDRIMSRYGDTPEGMVESCMEFLDVCVREAFHDVVISIKSSNTLVMTETVRLLCDRMCQEGMTFPLHLGVTEAGDGEDGRVKSAVGIGALLSEGIGDTIRVSLSESPEAEIPVGHTLVQCVLEQSQAPEIQIDAPISSMPKGGNITGYTYPIVVAKAVPELNTLKADERPDLLILDPEDKAEDYPEYKCVSAADVDIVRDIDVVAHPSSYSDPHLSRLLIISITHPNIPDMLRALGDVVCSPYVVHLDTYSISAAEVPVRMGYYLGGALLRGECAGVYLQSQALRVSDLVRLSFVLLQSSRRRITRTEFISCPGCGRTLFNLEETIARVKSATGHLKGLKIGVMGCIVNGPGEMADADYGYVGSSPGAIDLYKGKECVERQIPQNEAVQRLVQLIQVNGDWEDPK